MMHNDEIYLRAPRVIGRGRDGLSRKPDTREAATALVTALAGILVFGWDARHIVAMLIIEFLLLVMLWPLKKVFRLDALDAWFGRHDPARPSSTQPVAGLVLQVVLVILGLLLFGGFLIVVPLLILQGAYGAVDIGGQGPFIPHDPLGGPTVFFLLLVLRPVLTQGYRFVQHVKASDRLTPAQLSNGASVQVLLSPTSPSHVPAILAASVGVILIRLVGRAFLLPDALVITLAIAALVFFDSRRPPQDVVWSPPPPEADHLLVREYNTVMRQRGSTDPRHAPES